MVTLKVNLVFKVNGKDPPHVDIFNPNDVFAIVTSQEKVKYVLGILENCSAS